MARKAFLATEAMRGQVRSVRGTPQEDIAKLIGCDAKTLRKHFRKELDLGMAEANAAMCGYLFAAAAAGNVAAQIFWMKTRMHLRERDSHRRTKFRARMLGRVHRWSSSCLTTAEILSSQRRCVKHRTNTSPEDNDDSWVTFIINVRPYRCLMSWIFKT